MARKHGSNGEQTARDIRSAALRLFADKGYAAVSMRQIAAAVGVQVGALYLYTSDKQALLADLMIGHMEDLLSTWSAALPQSEDPVARLEHFVRFHIRYHITRVDEVFIAYMELRNLTPENFARVERLRRLYEEILEGIIADGLDAGAFRLADPRVSGLALIAMLTGVTTWYRSGGRLSADRIEDVYCTMALNAVGVVRHSG